MRIWQLNSPSKKSLQLLQGNQGAGAGIMVVALTVLVLLTVLWGELTSTISPVSTVAQNQAIHNSAKILQDYLLSNLNNTTAFSLTINDNGNTSMRCLSSTTMPCATSGAPFAFRVRNGSNEIINNTPPTSGLKMGGGICNTFDGVNGNEICPFRYNLTWQPICPPSGACLSPMIEINAVLEASFPGKRMQLNMSNYKIHIIR